MTLPADLILTEANVTFPTNIALDGTETFTLTINNTPQAGGADVNEDFYIIVQLTPDLDLNQNYFFEFLYPASLAGSGIAANSSITVSFDISFEYSYISKPLIGNPVAPTVGTYEAIISVNLDAMGRRYVSESDFYNNSVRLTSIEVTPSLGNRPEPGYEGCRMPLGPPTFPPPPTPTCLPLHNWFSDGGSGGGDDDRENSDYDTDWGWDDGYITDGNGADCFVFNKDEAEYFMNPHGSKGDGGRGRWDPFDEGWALHTPPVSDFGNNPPSPNSPLPDRPDENGDPIPSGNRGGDKGHGNERQGGVVHEMCDDFMWEACPEWDIPETSSVTEGEYTRKTPNAPSTPSGGRTGPATPPSDTEKLCWEKPCPGSPETGAISYIRECTATNAFSPGPEYSVRVVPSCSLCPKSPCPPGNIGPPKAKPSDPGGFLCWSSPCPEFSESERMQICMPADEDSPGRGWTYTWMEDCSECPTINCQGEIIEGPGISVTPIDTFNPDFRSSEEFLGGNRVRGETCNWWVYNTDTEKCEEVPIEANDCTSPFSGYYTTLHGCIGANTNNTELGIADFMNVGNTSLQSNTGQGETNQTNVLSVHYRCTPTNKGNICLAIPDYAQNKDAEDTYSTYNKCAANCGKIPEEVTEVLSNLPNNINPPVNFVVPRHLN